MRAASVLALSLALLLSLGVGCAAGGASDDDAGVDAVDVTTDRGARPVDTAEGEDGETGGDALDDGVVLDVVDVAPDVGPSPARFASLRIEPRSVTLATTLGVPVTATVAAIGTTAEGVDEVVTGEVVWRSQSLARANVSADGTLTASGTAAGIANFYATLDDLRAEAVVDVRVSALIVDADITPDELAAFSGAADAPAPSPATWVYPNDETVYPAGLTPPVLQWNASGNAIFHLALDIAGVTHVDVVTRTPSYTFGAAEWALVSEHFGLPITMSIAAATAAGEPVSRGEPIRLFTADADLEGAVYYWQIRTGDIMEIPYDEPEARPLFPDNAETGSCRGCHAITRDGGRIGFMYNGGDNPRAGVAWVGAPDPPVVPNSSEFQWDSLSFEPAGLRAAAVFAGSMWLADTTPDLPGGIANLGPISQANADGRVVTHPAWSPDGTQVVFVARDPGGVDWSFAWGDIWTMPWDAATETFGEPRMLIARGAGDQDTVSYPTWSPDTRWIAYSQGPDNRGEPPANLFIADPISGASTQLLRGAPAGQDVLPAFSPFREGGYYWLLFYSRRPYGNVTTNKQLWVMAIDEAHVTGTDPSHPAFWLPGQNPAETNITAVWARSGCARESNECKTDDDCCVGLKCIDDDVAGTGTCQAVDCVLPARPCVPGDTCCPGFECASSLTGSMVCVELFE